MTWVHDVWFGYFVPSLYGNGPEALAQTVVYAGIAMLIWPPTRKAIQRYTRRHVDELKAHVQAENAHLHAKLNHIVRHTKAIPNEVPGLPPEHQP